MLIAIISTIAVLAFLVVLCFIYADNIKAYFSRKKSKNKKPKVEAKPPKAEPKPEEFIPLKNYNQDQERDESLQELFGQDDFLIDQEDSSANFDDFLNTQTTDKSDVPLDIQQYLNSSKTNAKKPISQQIQELSPELKALLLDTTLKKRDDI